MTAERALAGTALAIMVTAFLVVIALGMIVERDWESLRKLTR